MMSSLFLSHSHTGEPPASGQLVTASTRKLLAWIVAEGMMIALVTAVIGPSENGDGRRLFVLALLIAVALVRRVNVTLAITAVAVVAYVVARALDVSTATDLAPPLTHVMAGALCLVGVAIVSDFLAQSVRRLDAEVAARSRTINDLERIDPTTGLVRASYGLEAIEAEVARGGLHGRDCSLVLIGLDPGDEAADARAGLTDGELQRRLAEAYRAKLSVADSLIEHGDDILALLVETGAARGELVAAQLCEAARSVVATPARAGVASFPVSEVTAEGLVAEAEASLAFARAARVPVAGPELLSS